MSEFACLMVNNREGIDEFLWACWEQEISCCNKLLVDWIIELFVRRVCWLIEKVKKKNQTNNKKTKVKHKYTNKKVQGTYQVAVKNFKASEI